MYHDFQGREIEDLEGDNMQKEWFEYRLDYELERKARERYVWKRYRDAKAGSRRLRMAGFKSSRRIRTRQWRD